VIARARREFRRWRKRPFGAPDALARGGGGAFARVRNDFGDSGFLAQQRGQAAQRIGGGFRGRAAQAGRLAFERLLVVEAKNTCAWP
jgi:hypothetical protein